MSSSLPDAESIAFVPGSNVVRCVSGSHQSISAEIMSSRLVICPSGSRSSNIRSYAFGWL
jgi:hypothetical protein